MRVTSVLSQASTIKWGILSAGKISSDFAKAIAISPSAECVAVAARSEPNAAKFAKEHNVPTSYGSYDELLNDPSIDVVYVGSIADQHAKMAKQSLLAGKPTVVEKPMTLTMEETLKLVQLAREKNLFLLEGMWTRFFPAINKVCDVIASGEIGNVVNVQGDFGWSNVDCPPEDRIWNPKSGGMTYDIGMYMAQFGQVAYPGADIERIQAMATTKNGVDQTVLTNIMYKGNAQTDQNGMLQFYVTGAANTEERVLIQCEKGRIVLDSPAHVPQSVRVLKDVGRGKAEEEAFDFSLPDDTYTTWNYPGSIGFTYQVEEVCKAIKEGKKQCSQFTWNDSIQLAGVIDEIRRQTMDEEQMTSKVDTFVDEKISA